jgi:hypothetical protein
MRFCFEQKWILFSKKGTKRAWTTFGKLFLKFWENNKTASIRVFVIKIISLYNFLAIATLLNIEQRPFWAQKKC